MDPYRNRKSKVGRYDAESESRWVDGVYSNIEPEKLHSRVLDYPKMAEKNEKPKNVFITRYIRPIDPETGMIDNLQGVTLVIKLDY